MTDVARWRMDMIQIKKVFKTFIIFLGFLGFSACMQIEGMRPSRVAIQNVEGDDLDELSLISGMTHKLYGAVYVATPKGERLMGDAARSELLSDVEFEVLDGVKNSISIQPNGCMEALQPGSVLVKLKGFSLSKGMLSAVSQITIKPHTQVQNRVLKTGISSFSVSKLPGQKSLYGLILGTQFFTLSLDDKGISGFSQTQGHGILGADQASDQLGIKNISSDLLGQGFYVVHATEKSDGKKNLGYVIFNAQGDRMGGFEATQDMDLKKVFIFQLTDTVPIALGVSKDKDKGFYRILAFKHALDKGVQEGFLTDSQTSKFIEFNHDEKDLDGVLNLIQDTSGTVLLALGTHVIYPDANDQDKTEDVNELKVIAIDVVRGVQTQNLGQQVKLLSPKAFAIEGSYDTGKLVYISPEGKLKFTQRLGEQWVAFHKEIAKGVQDFKPLLHSSEEDGSLRVVWKDAQGIQTALSLDGGGTWSDAKVIAQTAPQRMKLFSLPCGGALLLMLSGNNLSGYFLQKDAVIPISQTLGSGVMDFQVFRDHGAFQVFYMTASNQLKLLSMP